MSPGKMSRSSALKILALLEKLYPEVKSELIHGTPFELLVGTMLAAQATDRKVNEVTEKLFSDFKSPEEFLSMTREQLEQRIREIHFCRVKARHILSMCGTLVTEFRGEVPSNREDLMKLAGVGRKTANVVLSYSFNTPAIAVDTHVHRVAGRLGMSSAGDVLETELEMEKLLPKAWWTRAHGSMVLHGRRVCSARNPKCGECALASHCRYYKTNRGTGPRRC